MPFDSRKSPAVDQHYKIIRDFSGNLHGRSERIRTSDPLLPKQVRYQAALRSDRVGRELSNPKGICKGDSCRYFRALMFSTRCKIEARGVVTVSTRPRVSNTGLNREVCAVLSRQTM